jgi:hypothetical protein
MKPILKTLSLVGAASAMLGGCAVYGPPPAYGEAAYYQPAPVYAAPAPVYVQPAPVYVGPPVTFGLNFGYRGGHGWRHHH